MPCQSAIYFFYFRKMYLFNETQYMRHCTASRNELNTYVRQYTCTWLIDPEHVTHSVKSLTWFNWFTDNKNIIFSACPSSKQYTPEISGRPWLDHVTGCPYTITKRGKGGAYVDIIRLWSTTCEPPVTLIRYFLLLYSLLLQYAE